MIVYICWEGRGYTCNSLFQDLAVTTRLLEEYTPGSPVYYMMFDVGVLISNTPTPDFTKVVSTRHGEENIEDWTQDDELQDFSEYKNALKPESWKKHENFYLMLHEWISNEWVS